MDEEEERAPRVDDTAQRLLNLMFTLNAAAHPLTTDQIIGDSDLGYGHEQRESDLRKFRRDREKLAERGIIITEVVAPGASEAEQRAWAIDRKRTFAAGGIAREDDVRLLARAVDEYLGSHPTPLAIPLKAVRRSCVDTLAALAGEDEAFARPAPKLDDNAIADAVWTAFSLKRSLIVTYRNAAGTKRRRTVAVYGIFTSAGLSYFTGLDREAGTVRTFRTDRVERVHGLGDSYDIPSDFSIRDHLFLPFDFSDAPEARATFSFSPGIGEMELAAITQGRGDLVQREDGGWTWDVEVRDIDAAAEVALAHARFGMRPVAPDALVESWRAKLMRAVGAHDA